MKIGFLKMLALYFIVFGIIGSLVQLSESLHDYQNNGAFFLRSSPLDFLLGFFITPLFGLISFFFSFMTLSTFAPDVVEVHMMIILFFGFAGFGLLKGSRFILLVAALVPISWAILDLGLLRSI